VDRLRCALTAAEAAVAALEVRQGLSDAAHRETATWDRGPDNGVGADVETSEDSEDEQRAMVQPSHGLATASLTPSRGRRVTMAQPVVDSPQLAPVRHSDTMPHGPPDEMTGTPELKLVATLIEDDVRDMQSLVEVRARAIHWVNLRQGIEQSVSSVPPPPQEQSSVHGADAPTAWKSRRSKAAKPMWF